MRKIKYIFIDSDYQNDNSNFSRRAVSLFRHHFIVNSEGLVINPIDISQTVNLIQGPIYERDKYNKCSISIYCDSLRPKAWLIDQDASCATLARQRAALLQLLAKLRKHFPDAKILGVSEIDGKEPYAKNIIVSDSMNLLRRQLSDLS